MFWLKSRTGKLFEAGLNILDAAIGFGLVSCATAAAVFGKVYQTILLGLLAVGIFLRLKRRNTSRALAAQQK